ncbi:hypothetical protein ACA910_016830 [Epithemia clementina (nom. ined.)]
MKRSSKSSMHQALISFGISVLGVSFNADGVGAFQAVTRPGLSQRTSDVVRLAASRRGTIVKERSFDPTGMAEEYEDNLHHYFSGWDRDERKESESNENRINPVGRAAPVLLFSSLALLSEPSIARAAREVLSVEEAAKKSGFDPSTFQPVCPTADGLYRIMQRSAEAVIGPENAMEYSPLIAGGLLRVRLELCVVESFFNEAVGPFIERNGYSWILPLHETVESFIAGTVFAFTATFILIGSTKIITVIVTYADFLIGLPSRLFGGFFYDRALGKPVTLDIGLGPFKTRVLGPRDEDQVKVNLIKQGPFNFLIVMVSGGVKLFGQVMGFLRALIDALDFFVGRYLVVWATGYVIIKFVHFKIFPHFP